MVILKKDLSDGYIIIDRNKINFLRKKDNIHIIETAGVSPIWLFLVIKSLNSDSFQILN